MKKTRQLTLMAVLMASGCAPAEKTVVSLPQKTTLVSTSTRCSPDGTCRCRDMDAAEGQTEDNLPAGHKRFEFRLPRTTSALWVSVAGLGTYYKPPQNVLPACFYLDLPPGEHRVSIHSERKDMEVGLQTGLSIFEYGPKDGPHWYRSLEFVCGGGNKCTKDEMESWITSQRALPRGVLDPCGSVMVRGAMASGRREERLLPEYVDLDVNFVLKVYAFETYRQPGSPECREPVKNRL